MSRCFAKLWISALVVLSTTLWWNLDHLLDLDAMTLRACSFEVFGLVQGVFFRKYTQQEAVKLGVVGWIRNTARGTVEGEIQGPEDNYGDMKRWLETKGSPQSEIAKAIFSDERTIDKRDFESFDIRRTR
ncbi:acylphosphatase-2 [Galendromus occidentalis]|uniref:acylphosphatase n=1 Tax=Galendromus occidentalis TaxID=34638 RepID=A0AAJ6QWF7_9ACAR|nr:acylphosphatase-2 [Galendromus occidentalis]